MGQESQHCCCAILAAFADSRPIAHRHTRYYTAYSLVFLGCALVVIPLAILILPSQQLAYTSCFGDFECTRLEVPMDWNSTYFDGDRVAIAIIRLPAVMPVTDPRYGGLIVINPGGPGASGIDRILHQGSRLQQIVDPQSDPSLLGVPYFDILGYDPRGVNNTTPRYECFSEPYARQRWTEADKHDDIFGTSEIASEKAWARAMALGDSCTHPEGPKLSRFINTTPGVADIIEIIERHADEIQSVIERTRWRKGEEQLQYWGFSYGAVLGATFAALQPHRVKRLINDGVYDAEAMFSGLWTTSLNDSDQVMESFFASCFEAGPTSCSFYDSGGPFAMHKKLDVILARLRQTPLAVPASKFTAPQIITYSDFMRVIKDSLYRPIDRFPELADLLQDLVANDGRLFAKRKNLDTTPICKTTPGVHCPPYEETILEALLGISCGDGQDLSNRTQTDFLEFYSTLRGQSRWMAEIWVGPFAGEPAQPILWIGNTLDPATPLANAHRLAAQYKGSVVLQQDSIGHCSYSAPSDCTDNIVRNYFQNGVLPKPGTICKPDKTAFSMILGRAPEGPASPSGYSMISAYYAFSKLEVVSFSK
ncbi:alpha/beta-hydrolase [Cadophora sp. DSE1049]|nr:alpha/beta-hydrolase [Cadophora sp. DSE1049]